MALHFLAVALLGSRIGAELLLPQQPLVGFLIGLGAGVLLGRLMATSSAIRWFPILLLPAILWPFQSPALLIGSSLLVIIFVAAIEWHANHIAAELAVVGLFAVLYGLTLAPGIQPADSGEFQLVLSRWGIAHPPGYPLYTVIGGMLVYLFPPRNAALGANLYSALTALITLFAITRAMRHLTGSGWAGIIAATLLGTATTFWTTATQASIRPMTTLFMALMVVAALWYRRTVTAGDHSATRKALIAFGLAAGFGVTHHASLLFAGTVLAAGILAADLGLIRSPRRWLQAIGAALLGALPWLYLVFGGLRSAPLAPPGLATWRGFWQHVLAAGFAGDMFYYRTLPEITGRLRIMLQVLTYQWNGLVLLLAMACFALLLRRDRWAAWTLGLAVGVHTFVAATYRAPQTVEYMLPAYVGMVVIIGLAIPGIANRTIRSGVIALSLLAAILAGYPTWISLRLYQQVDPSETNARSTLEAAPDNSIVYANWHHATPLWVLQATEGLRPDVVVRYVAPAGNEPILETWQRLLIEAHNSDSPIMTCSYYPETFRHTDLAFSAAGACWQVGPPFVADNIQAPAIMGFEEGIALQAVDSPAMLEAGQSVALMLTWQLPKAEPYGRLTGFVHLIDPDGFVVAQADQPIHAAGLEKRETVTQRLDLFIPRTTLPGEYTLAVGLYRPGAGEVNPLYDASGALRTPIQPIVIVPSNAPPVTEHRMNTPLDDHLRLAGYDVDLSVPGRARLYLHWHMAATETNAEWQITVSNGENALHRTMLKSSNQAGYVSTAHDIPDTEAARGVAVSVTREGEPLAVRGAWQFPIQPAIWIPPVQANVRYIPVGDVLVTGISVQEDSQVLYIDITIRSQLPIVQDMTLAASTPLTRYDVPPADGMLPTLKWHWGTTLTQTLSFPPDERPARLVFYDSFTSSAWPVLDPVLGQTSPAITIAP
ncbi:MAG: hypothetical protein Kow0077_06760 [Anaerolineae bacterium]